MRWSKLRVLIQELFDPRLKIDIHCTAMRGEGDSIGKYWIVLDGETIWQAPQNVGAQLQAGAFNDAASQITVLLREYLDAPRNELLSREFSGDRWGIIELLRAADRRIGKAKLKEFFGEAPLNPISLILQARGVLEPRENRGTVKK